MSSHFLGPLGPTRYTAMKQCHNDYLIQYQQWCIYVLLDAAQWHRGEMEGYNSQLTVPSQKTTTKPGVNGNGARCARKNWSLARISVQWMNVLNSFFYRISFSIFPFIFFSISVLRSHFGINYFNACATSLCMRTLPPFSGQSYVILCNLIKYDSTQIKPNQIGVYFHFFILCVASPASLMYALSTAEWPDWRRDV